MKRNDLLELAGRNLREALLRSSLTTLGIAVGVASLVAMLSLGVGLQNLANRRLERSGLFDTVMVLSSRAFAGPGRGEQRNNPAETRVLNEGARQEIARLPNVLEVNPEIRFPCEVRYHDRQRFTTVSGLPTSSRASDALDNLQGHFFSDPGAEEVILQADFAKQLADSPTTLIGREITLRFAQQGTLAENRNSDRPAARSVPDATKAWGFSVVRQEQKLRVAGITQAEPGGALRGPARAGVFIPIQLAEAWKPVQSLNLLDSMRAPAPTSTYQALVVRVAGPTQVRAVEDAVKRMGFRTFSLLDATQNLRRFFAVLDLFLGMFGSLALAVASLGIINTLVMAILERRREIGIMKALGASDRDIKRLFFAEAGAMGLAGGLAGVALGWAIGRVINFGTNIYLRRQELPPETIWWVPWWLVVGAIVFAVVVSLVSGLYPAARAAKLNPVQALRYE